MDHTGERERVFMLLTPVRGRSLIVVGVRVTGITLKHRQISDLHYEVLITQSHKASR